MVGFCGWVVIVIVECLVFELFFDCSFLVFLSVYIEYIFDDIIGYDK